MKKLLSAMLSVSMVLTLASPAFAAEYAETETSVIGEVIHDEVYAVSDGSRTGTATKQIHSVISSITNDDGSVTIYEYENGDLIQYHITVPGSGSFTSTYINDDGSQVTEETIMRSSASKATIVDVADSTLPELPEIPAIGTAGNNVANSRGSSLAMDETYILSPTSVRPLGYMNYRHTFTNTIYSINCEVREKYHGYEYYTFNEGLAGNLSFWISSILSICAFHAKVGTLMAKEVVQGLITYGLIGATAAGIYEAVATRTIPCYWYDQEIHGTPTAPSGSGDDCYLPGVYCYVNYGNGLEVRTEGYTVRDWGNPSMGRWMMYNVFGIDEAPTSWTNLDL